MKFIAFGSGIGVFGILAMLSAPAFAETNCDVTSMQAAAPEDTTIESADFADKPIAHCKVEGFITTTNPGPNQVNFRLQLPEESQWQGRYYFIGMGATAGFVPTNSQIPGGNPLLKGFAVAGTDTGHQHTADWAFMGDNPAKAEDHVHRGAHVTAIATQQITKKYYGTDKIYRYHSGCSGGGRMGMEAITRHPEDYDGILIGAPGMGPKYGAETMIGFIYLAQQMDREPGAWLAPEKLQMLEEKVTAQCDELDGANDGVVWDDDACKFDFKALQCESGDGPDCLTEPELRSIDALLKGPQGPNGPIKAGFPISNMTAWSTFIGAPPPWPENITGDMISVGKELPPIPIGYVMGNSLAQAYFGSDFNGLKDFDLNDPAQLDAWWDGAKRVGFGNSFSTDLSAFKNNGGKAILWNGVSDPCCIDQEFISYFNAVGENLGGSDALADFARFYRIPGMAHCGGGTGPQDAPDALLQSLISWVEEGTAPGQIVTHRGDSAKMMFADPETGTVSGVVVPPSEGSARDFLLCPHPQYAKFNGKDGGEMDAENWTCQ